MSEALHIGMTDSGKAFTLPVDAVTQTVAVLAKRRAGKSYTMRRIAEQLYKSGQQIVIVDPKGDQWGIRSSADGNGPGLPIVILGGERGDVPLEPSGGEVVAKLVVEERVGVLLDLSPFRKHEVATFMTAFLENLYRLKAREVYRTPMMLVIDEADAIAPQKPQKGEERMLGAAEDIVRRGGQRGIGCVLVTQRSAVLNKNVLTQAQIMIALRTIAPQDLAAMNSWIDVHGTEEQKRTLMASLPSLPVGDAWFWSPGWPTVNGIFKLVHVSPIETFDSGATPRPGEKRIEPKRAADVDLDALKRQMAATIERAKADDPKELRRQIADLQRQLRERPAAKPETVEAPVLKDAQIDRLEKLFTDIRGEAERHGQAMALFWKNQDEVAQALLNAMRAVANRPLEARPVTAPKPIQRPASRPLTNAQHIDGLTGPERKLLSALVAHGPCSIKKLAIITGYAHGGGAFRNPLGSLRSKGYIDGRETLRATSEASRFDFDPLPIGKDLQSFWLNHLSGPESKLLAVLIDIWPKAISLNELAERTNYEVGGGAFRNPLGRLRTLGLIEGRGEVKASDHLYT